MLKKHHRNSIRYAGNDVTITVGDLDDGFYIEDDGPGIPQQDRDDIFTMKNSTNSEGTGFGLSIVKQVVEALGWSIHATGGTAGGARFEIANAEFGVNR